MVKSFTETPADPPVAKEPTPISKTKRKRQMHALQALGASLIGIGEKRLSELNLPDTLYQAIKEAEKIKAHGAKARQIQYIGRLMRDIDPEPIEQHMALWAQGKSADEAVVREAEQWREKLLTDSHAIDALIEQYPGLERKSISRLIERVQFEKAKNGPPTAYRQLFRLIRNTLLNTTT